MRKKDIARNALEVLIQLYPELFLHLNAGTPWELLVATILSAQCTDARVNKITPALFKRFPTPAHFAAASQEEMEGYIRTAGFYHNKAKNIIASAARVTEVYGGEVPNNMNDLLTLPGVARKTANVVLWGAFGINDGLAVDTHVARIAERLGLCPPESTPQLIEKQLCALFPQAEWGGVNHRMVSFGRMYCVARAPKCVECPMATFCPSFKQQTSRASSKKNKKFK